MPAFMHKNVRLLTRFGSRDHLITVWWCFEDVRDNSVTMIA